jgi:hypothetical protein
MPTTLFDAPALVETTQRFDIWAVVKQAGKDGQRPTRGDDLTIAGTLLTIVWDEPMPMCHRPWFVCPQCKRRCRHLYVPASLACRTCHQLDYAGQRPPGLYSRELVQLRKSINEDVRPFLPIPKWKRIRDPKICKAIDREERALLDRLRALTRELERLR